ncbi:MAG: aminotransferase class V-fold PLP-dependent enzyme [Devosia sp.]
MMLQHFSGDASADDVGERLSQFPPKGRPWQDIKADLTALKSRDLDWKRGRLPAYIYYYDEDVLQVQTDAYRIYAVENGLGEGKAFHSLTAMLADISAMSVDLFGAPPGAGVSFTSGGTESLFEAVRTAKKRHRQRHGKRDGLNVVAPVSAHATLNKAGDILDVEIVRVPLGAEWRADVGAMEAAINENTIMVFASAPCFPYGVFDPIPALGAIAKARDLWLHVDGCWGGFISPFALRLGYLIPPWDLSVDGVTSLSADIHKFAYGAKGASLLIFRDAAMKELERFSFSGWPRGTYATPTFLGSRPAGAIASAWAVMNYLGMEGYLKTTKAAMDATMGFIKGIDAIDGVSCLQPVGEANLYAFVSDDTSVDIMAVADHLQARGWFPGRLREPVGIQQGVNPVHLPIVDDYVEEVAAAVRAVRDAGTKGAYRDGSY